MRPRHLGKKDAMGWERPSVAVQGTLATTSLLLPFFQVWSDCCPSPNKFIMVEVSCRGGKQQVVRLPIAIRAAALKRVLDEGAARGQCSVHTVRGKKMHLVVQLMRESLAPYCSTKRPCNSGRHWPAWDSLSAQSLVSSVFSTCPFIKEVRVMKCFASCETVAHIAVEVLVLPGDLSHSWVVFRGCVVCLTVRLDFVASRG